MIGCTTAATVREDERHGEPEPVMRVAAAAQQPGGVHPGHHEPDNHERGQPHVQELQPHAVVEHRPPRVHVGHRAVADR